MGFGINNVCYETLQQACTSVQGVVAGTQCLIQRGNGNNTQAVQFDTTCLVSQSLQLTPAQIDLLGKAFETGFSVVVTFGVLGLVLSAIFNLIRG